MSQKITSEKDITLADLESITFTSLQFELHSTKKGLEIYSNHIKYGPKNWQKIINLHSKKIEEYKYKIINIQKQIERYKYQLSEEYIKILNDKKERYRKKNIFIKKILESKT